MTKICTGTTFVYRLDAFSCLLDNLFFYKASQLATDFVIAAMTINQLVFQVEIESFPDGFNNILTGALTKLQFPSEYFN